MAYLCIHAWSLVFSIDKVSINGLCGPITVASVLLTRLKRDPSMYTLSKVFTLPIYSANFQQYHFQETLSSGQSRDSGLYNRVWRFILFSSTGFMKVRFMKYSKAHGQDILIFFPSYTFSAIRHQILATFVVV